MRHGLMPIERTLPLLILAPGEVVAVALVEPRVRRQLARRVVDVLVEGLVVEDDERVRLAAAERLRRRVGP